ncbi:membrane protein, partial [sediment metagenome]
MKELLGTSLFIAFWAGCYLLPYWVSRRLGTYLIEKRSESVSRGRLWLRALLFFSCLWASVVLAGMVPLLYLAWVYPEVVLDNFLRPDGCIHDWSCLRMIAVASLLYAA